MAETTTAFEFRQCISILKSIGKKAKTLRELREILAVVSDESIFHHTYQYFLKGPLLEYTNEFAQWAGDCLEERELAEQLSNIDPYEFKSIGDLRNVLLHTIDSYLNTFPEPRPAMQGRDFYFNETITLTYSLDIRARNLAEFLMGIKYIDAASIYYHFYEARTRLGRGIDDFSMWVESVLGKKALAEKIRAIDPFMHTTEGIRVHIAAAVEEELRKDMGVVQ